MPKLKDENFDIVASPKEIAQRRYQEQLEAVKEQLVPHRSRPVTEALHRVGLRLKDLTG